MDDSAVEPSTPVVRAQAKAHVMSALSPSALSLPR